VGGNFAVPAGGYMDDIIRIEALENGFEVECLDPKVVEENAKPKGTYRDPYKGYAFTTADEVVAFVKEKLGKMKPNSKDGGYASAFKEASSKT
jgi:predicted membrane GTPase involved in stress response